MTRHRAARRARAAWHHRPQPRRALAALAALGLAAVASCTDPVEGMPPIASATLTPDSVLVVAGRTTTLTFALRDSAGQAVAPGRVTWSSSAPTVATVTDAGVVSALATGEARIAASALGRSAVARVVVAPREVAAVQVTPASLSLVVGSATQLQARPVDLQGDPLTNRPVTWSSANAGVATVDASGRVAAVAPGATTITATSGGRSGQVAVTVFSPPVATVVVSPGADTVVVGGEVQLVTTLRDAGGAVLTGRPVAWNSANVAVATVSSGGLVRALAPGRATISATSEGRVGSATVTVLSRLAGAVIVSPSASTLVAGQSVQLRVQVTDALGNLLEGRAVAFASEAPAVATVTADGVVTAAAAGSTRIIATSDGRTGIATVQVIPVPAASVQVVPATLSLLVGAEEPLTAVVRSPSGDVLSGRPVTWTSGAPAIAGVSAAGRVTGLAPGTAVILAAVEGVSAQALVTVRVPAVASVRVTPQAPTLDVNDALQLTGVPLDAQGTPLADRTVTWATSDDRIAFVTGTGRVVALRPGTATITATSEGVSGTTIVTVR